MSVNAGGIDLGGTKIEAQVFGPDWQRISRERWPTPRGYTELVDAMATAVRWCELQGGAGLPVGVSAAGLINTATGEALTANLPATGKPLPSDIARAAGRPVAWINDCRALALSEASLGSARGADPALALVLGTGVAGGVVTKGALMASHAGVGGEFGHFALPAAPLVRHGLPVLACGCGRSGCAETYLAAPGLARIALHLTGRQETPEEIVKSRAEDPGMARVWEVWLDIAAEFLITLQFTIDPAVIVLGGGLSKAPGLIEDLDAALARAGFQGFPLPSLRLAEGGDASGARGAALAAHAQMFGQQDGGPHG